MTAIKRGHTAAEVPLASSRDAGAAIFTWRGDYQAAGWPTAYSQTARDNRNSLQETRSIAEVVETGVQLLLSAVEHRLIHHMVRHSAVETTIRALREVESLCRALPPGAWVAFPGVGSPIPESRPDAMDL